MASTSCIPDARCTNTRCTRSIKFVTRPGWKLYHGDQEARLCNQCYVSYMKKQFCYIHHSDSTSWSFCKSCNKKIHIPCIVSKNWYTTLEDGGIMCNGCVLPDTALVTSTQETTSSVPQTLVHYNNEVIDIEQLHDQSNTTPSTTKARAAINEKPNHPGKGRKHDIYRYTPRMTAEELGKIFKGSNAEVIPLFEKVLTASDMGRTGRLVLPKKCAEEFFPTIGDDIGFPIYIQDTNGKVWKFKLRTWPNSNSRMYVLEGFEPYGKYMSLSEGDTVTFCKLVPEEKLVIGNRKASSTPSQGMVAATTSKEAAKGKSILSKRKRKAVRSEQSGLVIVEAGVGSKRKTCETGLTGKRTYKKKNKKLAVEGSPRGRNVASRAVEKGLERRRYKKHASKRKTKSTKGKSKMVIGSSEPGPSERVETEVTEMENVVTLPVSLNWVKKGPCQRSRRQRATCVGLRPRDEGSSETAHDHTSVHWHLENDVSLRVEPESSNSLRVEPESSNSLRVEPESSNSLRVEPESSNSLRVEPESSNSLRVEPESSNSLRFEPESSNSLRVEPESSNSLRVEPVSSNSLRVEPVSSNALQVDPKSSNSLPVEPASCNTLRVEPGSSNALRIKPESSNRNGQTMASSSSGGNVLPFDLNLEPESDEEFIEIINLVEETSSGSEM